METCLYLSHLAFLIAQEVAALLHFDIINNRVSMTLDGHTVKLFLDSATPEWLVMSGEAYEKSNGVGACRELETGCYFCPPTYPCDDVLERPRTTIKYADEDTVEYVSHTGTLSIGNMTDIEVKFDLIISFQSPLRGAPPQGILGLALGNREHPSMLDQLKMLRVIKEVSVAIEASETESLLNGRLFLGGSPRSLAELYPVKFTTHPTYCERCGTVLRSELKTVNRRSRLPMEGSTSNSSDLPRQFTHVLVDTGCSALGLTYGEYEMISNKLRHRMQEKGNPLDKPLWLDEKGLVWVDTRAFKYLPVLGFDLMDDSGAELTSVRISPKHYVQKCYVDRCVLDLIPISGNVLHLGHPFFRAYFTYINLNTRTLFIISNEAKQSNSVPRLSTWNVVGTTPCPRSVRGSSLMTHGCRSSHGGHGMDQSWHDQNRFDLQMKRDRDVAPRTSKERKRKHPISLGPRLVEPEDVTNSSD